MSHYRSEDTEHPRTKRFIVEARDRTPGPEQPSLFDPPQGEQQALTNLERWVAFKRHNPGVVLRIWELALAEAEAGKKRISVNRIFEQIRAEGPRPVDPESEWGLNNNYRAPCADDLSSDHRLAGKIERRARRLQ